MVKEEFYEEEDEEEDEEEKIEAPFNMAIATLKRIDIILQQITNICISYPLNSLEKQTMHVNLIKQLYFATSPLLKPKDIEKYNPIVLQLDLKQRALIKHGVQKYDYFYNKELEYTLNKLHIELQQKISKFIMPSKRDEDGL